MSATWQEPRAAVAAVLPHGRMRVVGALGVVAAVSAGVALAWTAGTHTAEGAGPVVVAVMRAVTVLTACGTVGALAAGLLVAPPGPSGSLAREAHLASAASWAVAWAAASVVWAAATLGVASLTGQVLHAAPGQDADVLGNVVRTGVVTAWAASVVAVLIRGGSARAARISLLVALAGVGAMVLAGHSVHEDNRVAAVTAVALHVGAVTVWVGGLLAIALRAARVAPSAVELRRFSLLALGCYLVVGGSGLANLVARLGIADLLASGGYLTLLAAKVALFVVLGLAGAVHRTSTIRRVEAGRSQPFLLVVAGELLLMAAAAGFAVVLATTSS